jgi:hypothetical protein
MVGVPFLLWCDDGPSSRIAWPICICRSPRISTGPSSNETSNAVIVAIAVRNVM